jgi:alkylhydroperoxidase family enzyme
MEPRMDHPAFVVPGAMDALQELGAAIAETGLDPRLVELVCLRASRINGCRGVVAGSGRAVQLESAGEHPTRDRRRPQGTRLGPRGGAEAVTGT